jgi:uncharacterized protein YndB with AHSA1/START domain
MFPLDDRSGEWAQEAPIRVAREVTLPVGPAEVFEVLADHERWPTWFHGMRRARIDGEAIGVGALRTVWVGAVHVQERFSVWEPSRRLTFAIVSSSVPGLRAMTEDWHLASVDHGTRLTITVGAEARPPLSAFPGLVRAVVARSTRGAAGIVGAFDASRGSEARPGV